MIDCCLPPPPPRSVDFKSQPEPSPVLSQLSQRQQHQTQAVTVPPPGLESFPSQVKLREAAPRDSSTSTVNKLLQLPSMTVENVAVSAHQPQPKHIKLPKSRRIPPASKIPASAVEMPGSADVTGLNVQFGALEFGSEPSLSEFGSAASSENSSQIPISLYSKSLSDSLNTSLPMTSAVQNSTYTTSVITSSSLTSSSLSSTSPVATSSSYDQSSVHSRIAYQSSVSPSESAPGTITATTSSVPAPKTTDPPSALPSVASLPSTTSCAPLLPPASQHTATLPSLSQPGDLSSSPLSQLSSSLSSHQSSLASTHTPLSASTSHTRGQCPLPTALGHLLNGSNFRLERRVLRAQLAERHEHSQQPVPGQCPRECPQQRCQGCAFDDLRCVPVAWPAPSPNQECKAPPNLPQGAPPLLHSQYLVGPGGLLPAYPIYGYDELQMLQSRLPVDYYGIPFATPPALASRDGSLTSNPYSGDVTKFGRGDSASPAPPTTLAQPQQSQSQAHHAAQQPFLNPALPPGYSYTGLPYYTGLPGAFQYGPAMFVPPASAKQHGVSLSTAATPFQQASGYGQHSYSTGYDDLTPGTAAGDYSKGGYGGSSQTQNKAAGSGPGKGVSATSSTSGLPDMTGSVYNKTQTFDKQGFHAGTPPPFSLPSALGSTGPLGPGAAPGYAPPPFLHILPAHQQPPSQLLHHHLPQDAQRLQPAQPAQLPAAQVASLQTCLRQLSILDKLNPEVPPASAKQHGVSLSTAATPFQQASGYGQHSYSTGEGCSPPGEAWAGRAHHAHAPLVPSTLGYDDLTPGTAAGDYSKGGYGGSSQTQNKAAGSGPGKGVSATSSTSGLPDMTGSVYNKTQVREAWRWGARLGHTFDKQGFHAGTPPPFSLPSALGSTGPLGPGAAPGYAPPPFLHILPAHQQPPSQLLHHHLPQDAQVSWWRRQPPGPAHPALTAFSPPQSGSSQRNQPSSLQPKSQASKPAYGNSPYWTN
ncbi:UBAP2 [Cervus elaphus hippelaphus]|uniref:UBAP2 n=1 Tax=Cervus elaphus hippelaphus TaxID=46360 RepID=A0A212CMC4_CEREH|nr:UBAP2 [Cervus elaphus hippelaphus]